MGVIAGVPFTNVEDNHHQRHFLFAEKPELHRGTPFQLNLPFHLRLELDAWCVPPVFRFPVWSQHVGH